VRPIASSTATRPASKARDLITLLSNELAQEIFCLLVTTGHSAPDEFSQSAFLYSHIGDHEPAPLEAWPYRSPSRTDLRGDGHFVDEIGTVWHSAYAAHAPIGAALSYAW
jgi:hypothetical protein